MKPVRTNTPRKLAAAIIAGALAVTVTACSTGAQVNGVPSAVTESSSDGTDTDEATQVALAVDATQSAQAVLAANDEVHSVEIVDESAAVQVTLGSSDVPEGVSVDGSTVTISVAGTYSLTGELDGQVVINVPDGKVGLILDGVKITSPEGPAISAVEVDELTVVLAAGTVNTLTDSATYDEDADPNAAFYSAGDTTIQGTGSLTVVGNYNDGITSKDGLLIESGNITVEAVDDAIRGKDYIVVTGGSFDLTAGGDGLTSDNESETERGYIAIAGGDFAITAQGDGIAAETDVVVTGGTLDITTGTGSSNAPDDDTSTKGIKSGVIMVLEGGSITVDAQDDGLHSDGAIGIAGATVTVASGDDGVHAEGRFLAQSGSLTVTTSYEGIEAYHIELAGASIDVTASDDGLNAAGGSSSEDAGFGGGGDFPGELPEGLEPPEGMELPEGAEAPENFDPANVPDLGELPEGVQMPDVSEDSSRPSGGPGAGRQGEQGARPEDGQGRQGGPGGGAGGMGQAGDYSITISAGDITVTAEGDGIDSNGSLTIEGGTVTVNGPSGGGNGSMDVDGTYTITGGEVLTIGTSSMPVNPASGSQAWIALDSVGISSGDSIEISDESGATVYTATASVAGQRIFLSTATLTSGQTYTVRVKGTEAGTASAA